MKQFIAVATTVQSTSRMSSRNITVFRVYLQAFCSYELLPYVYLEFCLSHVCSSEQFRTLGTRVQHVPPRRGLTLPSPTLTPCAHIAIRSCTANHHSTIATNFRPSASPISLCAPSADEGELSARCHAFLPSIGGQNGGKGHRSGSASYIGRCIMCAAP